MELSLWLLLAFELVAFAGVFAFMLWAVCLPDPPDTCA